MNYTDHYVANECIFRAINEWVVFQSSQVQILASSWALVTCFEFVRRYVKPKHVDVADFLQEVTTPDGLQFLQSGYTPLTTDGFVEAYMDSDLHRDVLRIVNSTKV